MATAKKTAAPAAKKTTSTAVATRASGSVVSIQEALKKQAAEMGDRVAPATGVSISVKGGEFRFPDGRKTSDPIQIVVVDFAAVNNFYEGKFDPNAITPPACFAVGPNPLKLVPVDDAPNRQADSCAECPMNEFGSSGAGKACKNTRLLAVLPPDADADAPMWKLSVPPTSIKNWDAFVRQVQSSFQMPPLGVVVTVSFDDKFEYPVLKFGDPQPNTNAAVHFARQDEASKLVNTVPDFASYVKPQPAKKMAGARPRR